MKNQAADISTVILARVFPELQYGEDPDIELYFDLRAQGRMLDAVSIYNARLKPRYPDESKRVILLRLYRTKSPLFSDFLKTLLHERSEEIISRIKKNIDFLIFPLHGVSMRNTYAVLKSVEEIARRLSVDVDAARAAASAYEDYAEILKYKQAEMRKAVSLLNDFYDQASVSEGPTNFIATSYAAIQARHRIEEEIKKKNFFDLSKIEFDAKDVQRIEIHPNIQRDEDKVLAYCYKYWLKVEDTAFERIIWLYSKKYASKHYEIFRTIKTCRQRKYPDDDILTMVGTVLATSYSYTIQGDLYMQAAWRKIKAALYLPPPEKKLVPEQPSATVKKLVKARVKHIAVKKEKPQEEIIPAKASPYNKVQVVHTESLKAFGSISDKIKKLSGKAYDLHKELFLKALPKHIHESLSKQTSTAKKASSADSNTAENIIYEYMETHYTDAFMNWTESEQKLQVEKLGFKIDSLDTIIENCYRAIV